MSRPPFQLKDAQARTLVQQMPAIIERHPAGNRDHRPFVRDFLRAVHTATGATFSPAIYRRLLDAYAPDRRPSTNTLAQEKKVLDADLAREARAGRELDAGAGAELAAVVEHAVDRALARQRPAPSGEPAPAESLARAQRDFLQNRLAETERMLEQARAQAARLAGELQAAQAVRDALAAQLAAERADAGQQMQRIAELTKELQGVRLFSMHSVDSVRGETRAWQDRCAHLEGEMQRAKQHLEYFRQIAYQCGASIPPDLRPESTK